MPNAQPAATISALIDEHYALVYRYAFRLCGNEADAEDLTQQTFLTAQSKVRQLREASAARSWLCTIARNAYLCRGRQGVRTVPLVDAADVSPDTEPPDLIDPAALQSCLDALPEEFRTPLILFYFRGFSYKEIAQQLDIPLGTVMSRLSRGKSWLRKKLTTDESAGMDDRSRGTSATVTEKL